MISEVRSAVAPLVAYAAEYPVDTVIDPGVRPIDRQYPVEKFGVYYQGLIEAPVSDEAFATAAANFRDVDAGLGASILHYSVSHMEDGSIWEHREKILALMPSIEDNSGYQALESRDLIGSLDRYALMALLNKNGVVGDFVFDPRPYLAAAMAPADDGGVSFTDLYKLNDYFDTGAAAPVDVLGTFVTWAKDPKRGGKEIGLGLKLRDFSLGEETVYEHKGDIVRADDAISVADAYLAIGADENLTNYLEILLEKAPATGVKVYQHFYSQGITVGEFTKENPLVLEAYASIMSPALREHLSRLIVNPDDEPRTQVVNLTAIARVQNKKGEYDSAAVTVSRLEQRLPRGPESTLNLSNMYARNGYFASALPLYPAGIPPTYDAPLWADYALKTKQTVDFMSTLDVTDRGPEDLVMRLSEFAAKLLLKMGSSLKVDEQFAVRYPLETVMSGQFIERVKKVRESKEAQVHDTDYLDTKLLQIYAGSGRFDEALATVLGFQFPPSFGDKKTGAEAMLAGMAKAGRTDEAITIYESLRDPSSQHPLTFPSFHVAMMGLSLIRGDEDNFSRFYDGLPDYQRSTALFAMFDVFKDEDLPITPEQAALIVKPDAIRHVNYVASSCASVGRLLLGREALLETDKQFLR